jgi:hypothetical protein
MVRMVTKKLYFCDKKRLICILIVYYISIMYMVKSKKNLTYKKKHNNSKKRKSILKKKTIKKINRNKNRSMKQKGGMEMGTLYALIPPALFLTYLGLGKIEKKRLISNEIKRRNRLEGERKKRSQSSDRTDNNPMSHSEEKKTKFSSTRHVNSDNLTQNN